MKLKELLKLIDQIAKEHGLSKPYIVGGVPRNILLGRFENLNDLDLTTGNEDVHQLAQLVAQQLGEPLKERPNGQKSIQHGKIKLDFSTNSQYENIDEEIKGKAKKLDDLTRETYSRDFTINTLLIPLDFSEVIDLTGQGKQDLNDRILRCPINCNIAFREDPNRILRGLLMAAKYDLQIPNEIKESIKDNIDLLDSIERKYASDKINEILSRKPEWLEWLLELGVLQKMPLTRQLSKLLINKKLLLEVL